MIGKCEEAPVTVIIMTNQDSSIKKGRRDEPLPSARPYAINQRMG